MTDILKTTRGDLMNLSKQLQNINNAQRKEIGELKGRVTQMENKAKSAPTYSHWQNPPEHCSLWWAHVGAESFRILLNDLLEGSPDSA